MVKVILADDHKIVREGIKAILGNSSEIEVVAEASNGKEVIEKIPTTHPDLVLMDINMPEMDGIEATRYIKKNFANTKVLILSMLDQQEKVKQLMDIGASGYILKTSGHDDLVNGIKTVASGGSYISAEITYSLLNKGRYDDESENGDAREKSGHISKREIEVLKLIASGLTNVEIAEALFNSKRTIESHRRNLIEKTRTKNTAELIRYAIKNGLIE